MRKAALLLSLAAACSHNTIPGTNVSDDPQTRAVLEVVSKYKIAMEAKDQAAILSLAAPTYYDPGDSQSGPVDYATLQKNLGKYFKNVNGVKLDLTVKDVQVKGEEAHVDYFQVLHYAIATATGEQWKTESDDARMKLVKVSGEWKIQSKL